MFIGQGDRHLLKGFNRPSPLTKACLDCIQRALCRRHCGVQLGLGRVQLRSICDEEPGSASASQPRVPNGHRGGEFMNARQ